MFKHRLIAVAILAVSGGIAVADEKTTVEVFLAAENAPESLRSRQQSRSAGHHGQDRYRHR